jgi:hypothetical protein
MSTKAEEFRYWTERSGPKKPKSPPRQRRDLAVDTSKPGVSATDRKAGARKESGRAGKKAAYALETSGKSPSRRSTRASKNRQRTDVKMSAKRRTAEARPGDRGPPRTR